MKRVGLLFMVLLLSSVFMAPVEARDAEEITNIKIDGDITSGFVRDAAANVIEIDTSAGNQGFIEFNTSSIPAAAIIDSITITFRTETVNGAPTLRLYEMTVQPSTQPDNAAGNQAIYDNIDIHTEYVSQVLAASTWYTKTLDASACTDLTGHMTWFSVGFQASTINNFIYSSESAGNEPYLSVTWHLAADLEYMFTDTFYENGTHYTPSVEVTVTGDGFSEEFNTSGGSTQYYPVEPEAFIWDIGGDPRNIYSIGEENLTITMPDSTYYTYEFTITDYTSKTPEFLEAYRTINGTQTLITREPINQPNTVPLNLVYGKTYRLKIVFTDGTRYDWGYFIPGSDSTITLILRTVTFTDQVQIILNDVFVEATRSTDGGTITVDYNDTLTNTVWANVTIRIRGGAVVTSYAYNNDSYTFNWASANASLGYVVTVDGEHSDYGDWGYAKIFDPDETFPDAPSLEGIFDFGLGANLGGWLTLAASVLIFSKAMQGRALLVGMVVATLTNYIGFSSWTAAQIVFGWFASIVIALVTGGNE